MVRIPAEQQRLIFVEATVGVIAEHGVKGATTRRIAEAAGRPLTTLHYLFHTKEDLFFAIFEVEAKLIREVFDERPTGSGLAEVAQAALRQIMEWFQTHPDYARAQSELQLWALRQDRDRSLARRSYEVSFDTLRGALDDAVGRPVDEELADVVARLIIVLVDGLLLSWYACDDDQRLAADLDTACETLALLIGARSGGRPANGREASA